MESYIDKKFLAFDTYEEEFVDPFNTLTVVEEKMVNGVRYIRFDNNSTAKLDDDDLLVDIEEEKITYEPDTP
jgi:hypothetical protein